MGLQSKHKVGRNEPCPCGSTLEYKKCHADPVKVAICNQVANETMAELVLQEQRKKIIRLQQAECLECGSIGKDEHGELCINCQFVTDSERAAYEYKILSEGDNDAKIPS